MREYTTQMDAARKGIVTKEMEIVAKKEEMDPKELMALMAEGKAIIPCNRLAHLLRTQWHRLYAEDKDQRESGDFPGL